MRDAWCVVRGAWYVMRVRVHGKVSYKKEM